MGVATLAHALQRRVHAAFLGGVPAEVDVKLRRQTATLEHAEDELNAFRAVVPRYVRDLAGGLFG
jgi:hypothetical protein